MSFPINFDSNKGLDKKIELNSNLSKTNCSDLDVFQAKDTKVLTTTGLEKSIFNNFQKDVTDSGCDSKDKSMRIPSPFEEIKKTYEEFPTSSPLDNPTPNQMSKWAELTGLPLEEARKDLQNSLRKNAAENAKKNQIMDNTRASNGLTFKEALHTYMKLYEKYSKECRVEVPFIMKSDNVPEYWGTNGRFIGGGVRAVDASKIEEKMSKEEVEQFRQAKAAIKELESNGKFMQTAKGSASYTIYKNFIDQMAWDRSGLTSWENYAKATGQDPESGINQWRWVD